MLWNNKHIKKECDSTHFYGVWNFLLIQNQRILKISIVKPPDFLSQKFFAEISARKIFSGIDFFEIS